MLELYGFIKCIVNMRSPNGVEYTIYVHVDTEFLIFFAIDDQSSDNRLDRVKTKAIRTACISIFSCVLSQTKNKTVQYCNRMDVS